MMKLMTAALTALVTVASPAVAWDGPGSEEIREYAFSYMKQFPKDFSDREIANQLASSIIWLEKVQTFCSSYYYVNADRARHIYLLRQGTWSMMFRPGKTSTAIMNEASAKRNREFNNSASKQQWCEDVKAFTVKTFGWGPMFEIGE
jgi:hypothetical protein